MRGSTLSRSLVWLFLLTALAVAQSTSGSISGTVKDRTGAPIPGAAVIVTDPATNVRQSAMTKEDGVFVAPQLPPGNYMITVERAGFKKFTKTGVVLSAADRLSAGTFILDIGEVADEITVTADAGELQIQSESGERSAVITGSQLRDLALNGRDVLDLMKLIPGITSDFDGTVSDPGNLGSFNINGTRGNQKEFTVDGSSNVDTGSNGGRHVTINPDAIAEIKVLTSNYQAEFGKAGGGFIQIVTSGGTKRFQGGLRFFHRHEGLNANRFFNNLIDLDRPLYRYKNIGWNFSGPVLLPGLSFNKKRNKLFFFANQEYYRQLRPNNPIRIRVPTAAERRGDFSQTADGNGVKIYIKDPLRTGTCSATNQTACFPNNIIPANRFYRYGEAILNIYPLPNIAGSSQYNYVSQESGEYPRRETNVRVDYQIDKANRLSFRVSHNADRQLMPYGTFSSGLNFPLTDIVFPRPSYNASVTLATTFSPTLLNEFIFGPSRNELTLDTADDRATRKTTGAQVPLLFPDINQNDYIPNFSYGGVNNQTFPSTSWNGLPFYNFNDTFNFIDNLTKVKGRHTMKTGIFAQLSRKDQTVFAPTNGNLNFNHNTQNPLTTQHPFSNALLGVYNTYEQASNFPTGKYRYWNIEGYAQDSWRVTRRLGLDFGLRVSWYQPQYDLAGLTSVFNPDFYDQKKAVRLYVPVCINNAATCGSGNNRRAIDPILLRPGFVPTMANTQPNTLVAQIVPGSGDIANGIVRNGENGYPKGGWDDRGMQWGPRFGFALDVFGRGKTVVRGGFGISYDRVQGNLAFNMLENPPNTLNPRLSFGHLDEIANAQQDNVLGPLTVIGYARDGNVPNVYSFSLNIQQALGFKTVLDIAYVGTQGRHLSQQRNLNAVSYGATFLRENQDPVLFANGVIPEVEANLAAVYAQAGLKFSGANAKRTEYLRPYPGYNEVRYREFSATSNYNALQVSVNRRIATSLTFGLAYTWSKVFTNASTDTATINPFDTRGYDYRLADFDRTHVLAVNYIYRVPALSKRLGQSEWIKGVFDGWEISGISRYMSGTPFELGVASQGLGFGQRVSGSYSENPRLFINGDPQKSVVEGKNGIHINYEAIRPPLVGDDGPWPRNYLRYPGFLNHDLSVFKNFALGKDRRRTLQIRLEAFNVLNQTQFDRYNIATNLAVATGTDANGTTFATGTAILNNYNQVIISNNIRGQRVADATRPLGDFFGEYNRARDPRVIQLGVKLNF
jgi:hypothetical protein